MKRFILLFIVIGLMLAGCSKNSTTQGNLPLNETDSTIQPMPEDMPNDFGFSVLFGIGKKNEVNTFKETVTKDLIEDGTATVNVALTQEEMNEIYERMKERMKEIKINEKKELVPEPINESICSQEPYEEDEWKITINGKTITHSVSGTYCEPTDDAKQLLELRKFVFSKIKSKEQYIGLPDSKGGYE